MISGHDFVRGIAWLSGGLAVLGCLYLIVCCVLVLRLRRSKPDAPSTHEPVTVLVPLCGSEPGLAGRLEKLANQTYPGVLQVICGVLDARDDACEQVRAAVAASSGRIELCVDPRVHGRNLKISNLVNMAENARHAILVMIDSDIEVAPDYLARVVAQLQAPGVGAVTCLYRGLAGRGLPARLCAIGIDTHFLPSVVFGMAVGLARPCFGATIAMTRADLDAVGGLEAFADCLWDDHAIGHAMRRSGRSVAVCDLAPGHVCVGTSLRGLFASQLRASRTIRGIDPLGHAGALVTHPFALALLAVLVSNVWPTWLLAAAALVCRTLVALSVGMRFGNPPAGLALIPLRDLLSFAVYVASYGGRTVEWRGQRYRVTADGKLTPTAN